MVINEGQAENRRGVLLKRPAERQSHLRLPPAPVEAERQNGQPKGQPNGQPPSPAGGGSAFPSKTKKRGAYDFYRFGFGMIWFFTLTLYLRPNDLLPIGTFPVAKIIAIIALLAYISAQMQTGNPIINRTTEAKMVYLLLTLAVLFIPAAGNPMDTINLLTETFIKVVIIFTMMISIIDTRERLLSVIKLIVCCGSFLAYFAIKSYLAGNFTARGVRIEGMVKGIFENPNDLATALDMLLPLAITLVVSHRGFWRFFYLMCTLIIAFGVYATYSRGGFLGLIAVLMFLAWKYGGKRRVTNMAIAVVVLTVVLLALPGGYRNRVVTIFNTEQDDTGSAQARTELLHRGIELAVKHPIVGVGAGNFHIYSIHEHVAHNAYVEIAAELGVIGLLAYLTIIITPFRRLLRVEKAIKGVTTDSARRLRYLNIGLQAQLVAYIVTSFFLSIQYLWYLYYAAAFAIALQQIYQAEGSKEAIIHSPTQTNKQSAAPAPEPEAKKPQGTLWPSFR